MAYVWPDLLFLLVLAASSLGYGLRLLGAAEMGSLCLLDRLALGLPLGLGLLAMAALGLGETGGLVPGALAGALGFGILIGPWRQVARDGHVAIRRALGSGPKGVVVPLGLAVVLLGSTGLAALAPVTDGDALCYHLEVAKRFLAAGRVGFDPDLHETVYPLVMELLDAYALALASPVASRLVSWLTGVGFGLAVASLGRPVLGGAGALWSAVAALAVPAVSNGMSAPLNDVALAAFCAAALVAWLRWREQPSPSRAALAGVMAGLALGVKYPALVWGGGLGLAALVDTRLGRRAGKPGLTIGQVGLFALMAALVGGPWYARAWWATGNPVYPFFRSTFGGAGIDDVLDPIKRPLAVTPLNLLTALGPMTLEPDRFDSFSHQFGPLFLMFLPGLLVLRSPRRVRWLGVAGMAFLMVCLTRRQSMRFVLAAVGPFSVAAVWVAQRGLSARGGLAKRLIGVAFVGVLVFQTAIAAARTRQVWPVLAGRESPAEYLARREPTVVVGQWMAAHLPVEARVIGQDHRAFYLPRPYTMELAHRRRTALAMRGEPAGQIVAALRARGYTHLLLCPPEPIDAVEFDGRLGQALGPWLRDREPVYRRDLADGDGIVRRYAIYELGESKDKGEGEDRWAAGSVDPEARR